MRYSKTDNLLFSHNSEKVKKILDWIICIVIAVVLALIFRYFIGTPTIVRMTSMFPTLEESDRLILNRTIRISKNIPKRGSIITFERPSKTSFSSMEEIDINNPVAVYENTPSNIFNKFLFYVLEIGKESYIKRVIALPGEHIQIQNGKVYINEKELDEPYLKDGILTPVPDIGFSDFVVPENTIFAMGDNRNGSMDCRNFGCIPIEKVEGIVLFRFFPLNKLGKI